MEASIRTVYYPASEVNLISVPSDSIELRRNFKLDPSFDIFEVPKKWTLLFLCFDTLQI